MTLIGKFTFKQIPHSASGRGTQWMAESTRKRPNYLHLMAIGPTRESVQEFAALATWAARTGHFENLSAMHPKKRNWSSCWAGMVPPHKRFLLDRDKKR